MKQNHRDAWTLGGERSAVESLGADSAAAAATRWEGETVGGYPSGAEWGVMDFGDGGAVAGVAKQVASLPDLSSPVPAVGAFGGVGEGLAEAGQTVAGRGSVELGRSLHRRDLCGDEKRGLGIGPTKRGKGRKITAIATGHSVPLAVSVQAASPHESQLVEEALGNSFLDELPARLIGDKAYDRDSLDRQVEEEYGIEMIAPHRRDRRHPTQDGRSLRRCRRRWTVERFFAWLQWFRRLVICYEYHIENFLGMVRLGCMKIMLRYF